MSDYFDYIEGLCSESTESWAIVQICEELDRRDQQIKELLEVKNAAEFFFGRSRCFEAVEQFRAECC